MPVAWPLNGARDLLEKRVRELQAFPEAELSWLLSGHAGPPHIPNLAAYLLADRCWKALLPSLTTTHSLSAHPWPCVPGWHRLHPVLLLWSCQSAPCNIPGASILWIAWIYPHVSGTGCFATHHHLPRWEVAGKPPGEELCFSSSHIRLLAEPGSPLSWCWDRLSSPRQETPHPSSSQTLCHLEKRDRWEDIVDVFLGHSYTCSLLLSEKLRMCPSSWIPRSCSGLPADWSSSGRSHMRSHQKGKIRHEHLLCARCSQTHAPT